MSGVLHPADVVDVHTHAMPLPLLEWLGDRGLAYLDRLGEGFVRLDPQVGGLPADVRIPCSREQYDMSARLDAMDAAGVGQHAVSLPPFLTCARAEDGALVAEVMRAANEHLAEFCMQAPGRLHALGSVPVGLPTAADEAEYCLDTLGMSGLAIGTQGAGRDLDHPVNEELWALTADRQVFCLLHPSAAPDPRRHLDFWLTQLVGFPSDTALSVARLILSGTLERHAPVLCLAHGGGTLPALRARLDAGWERKAATRTTPRPPSDYLRELYYDTAVFSPVAVQRLLEDVGPDRVLFGTDTPFDLADHGALATIATSGLDVASQQRVAGTNATALLRRALTIGCSR